MTTPKHLDDPHAGQPVRRAGPAPERASAALVLLHGRGGSADDVLSLGRELGLPGVALLAPQAAGHTWYPQSFLAPLAANQPHLDSGLAAVGVVVSDLLARGVPGDRVALLGFSQGACLACEYVARNPRRYGGLMALTGGLIGPPGAPRAYPGSLDGTPVFLGTSDPDPHVPVARVRETGEVLTRMGAAVELRLYPGMPHTVNEDEMAACRGLLASAAAGGSLAREERRPATAYQEGAMKQTMSGIHHVTAITADPQANIDFYTGVLGQRLVKLTVNFDDPGSYHLYYGDELGRPGTITTFFAWPGAPRGRVGPPQLTATSYAVPAGSLGYWEQRLKDHGVPAGPAGTRFGEPVLGFSDPDGLRIELVATERPGGQAPVGGPVPPEHATRGFHGVALSEEGYERTARLLTEVMGFGAAGGEGDRFRFRAAGGGAAAVVDLLRVPGGRAGALGAGVVHHVAFRTPDDGEQAAWRAELTRLGFNVSPVMDRSYFHSIYFREPGGVLFEVATDGPGFAADEPADRLGTRLMLPPQFERHRAEIERAVPAVRLPAWGR